MSDPSSVASGHLSQVLNSCTVVIVFGRRHERSVVFLAVETGLSASCLGPNVVPTDDGRLVEAG